jgi:hypothetical protein
MESREDNQRARCPRSSRMIGKAKVGTGADDVAVIILDRQPRHRIHRKVHKRCIFRALCDNAGAPRQYVLWDTDGLAGLYSRDRFDWKVVGKARRPSL